MFRIIHKVLDKLEFVSREQMAAYFLQDFIQRKPYLPHTISSLSFRAMYSIVNDLVINKRQALLEFGSGMSTIIFARAIKQNNLPATIVTVDENGSWLGIIQQYLENEGLLDIVQLVHAPVVQHKHVAEAWCYDETIVDKALGNKKFDAVLIDGPSGWKKGSQNSRIPVLELFSNRLAENYAVFIDNADRKAEKTLSANIKQALHTNTIPLTSSFHIHIKNKSFSFHY